MSLLEEEVRGRESKVRGRTDCLFNVEKEKEKEKEDSHSLPVVDSRTPYVQGKAFLLPSPFFSPSETRNTFHSIPCVTTGMNVLAAPFLYVMPSELEAFACFTSFIEREAPRYVLPTLEGVHAGLLVCPVSSPLRSVKILLSTVRHLLTCNFNLEPVQLVDLCLLSLDAPLHAHLSSHHLSAELYAFPSILTFCASTPPLSEVIELWDFLLAWGAGLNVLCVCAQLWLMRDELLECDS